MRRRGEDEGILGKLASSSLRPNSTGLCDNTEHKTAINVPQFKTSVNVAVICGKND